MSLLYGAPTLEDNPLLTKSFDDMSQDLWGITSQGRIEELQQGRVDGLMKAMGVNSLTGGGGLGDFGALRVEDLDPVMTKVLFNRTHLVMQRALSKEIADQLVYQYNVQHGYGDSRAEPGFREGWGPGSSNAEYTRETAIIRYLGIERGYTHQLGEMRRGTQVDPVQAENENGTLAFLELVERALTWGDSSLIDETGQTVAYDGLYKQIRAGAPAENVIDLRGDPFDLDILQDIGLIYHDYRFTNDFSRVRMFGPGQVFSDISKQYTDPAITRRMLGNTGPEGGYVDGAPVRGYETQFGTILFQPSVFMQRVPGNKPRTLVKGSFGAATTIASATAGADVSGTSEMDSGTYYYFVGVIYNSGESVVSAGVSATPSNGQQVTLLLNRTTQTDVVRGYRIYRGYTSDPSKAGWIGDVPDAPSGITFIDRNDIIPNTNIALVLEMSPENLAVAQLAPFMRLQQPIFKTTLPFYFVLYHTLIMKAPSRQFLIRNIGPR
jgi:hypothetical protein